MISRSHVTDRHVHGQTDEYNDNDGLINICAYCNIYLCIEIFIRRVSEDGVRTVYGVLTFDPLLDSSNMNPAGWTKMAKCIEKYYKEFDGFVILHGTDTMAYTSSALAFMLQGLTKPVIITGNSYILC